MTVRALGVEMSARWVKAEQAAEMLPVSASTIRRWVDAYVAWCRAQGVDPSSPDAPPAPDEPGYLRGWLLPERRGRGVVRAVDRADIERVRRLYRLGEPTAGGDVP